VYFDPRLKNHGLPRNPWTATVAPRPIGWISTLGPTGVVNLAPYSYFNGISTDPPFVMFASYDRKDSLRNAEASGEFVANLATFDLRHEMNITSSMVGPEISEPELAGLEMVPSIAVKPPRVKRSPIAHECKYIKTVSLEDTTGKTQTAAMVIGQVVGIHIDDSLIVDGMVDITKARPIARLGYMDYAVVDALFSIPRPKARPG
jgi:flavin reductase (DIM6/NTAB) family NADH-FMN oxidoreductase RutF